MVAGVVAFAALALWAAPAAAGLPLVYRDDGLPLFTVEAPDRWIVGAGVEADPAAMADGAAPMGRVVSMLPGEGPEALWVGVWSPPNLARLADGRAFFEGLQLGLLEAPVVERTEPRRINGLDATLFVGHGLREGRRFDFAVAFVQVTRDRVAILATIGEPAARERHADDLRAVLDSVRRTPGDAR